MTARWFTLAFIAVLVGSPVALLAQQGDSKAEESRGPGRFFRKLREDFAPKKEEEAKAKETPRTADRSAAAGREEGGFQPIFSPPAFLGGSAGKRNEQEQDGNPPPSRTPFKLSQPSLPPPVANTLPRNLSGQAQPQRLPAPAANSQRLPANPRPGTTRPATAPNPGARETPVPNPSIPNFEVPTSPVKKLPKPPLYQGFGFELSDTDDGLEIKSVKPDGNADQAKLKKGDRITQIGGVEVELKQQFEEIAEMLENGDQIEIVIARRGKEEDITLQFGQPPVVEEPAGSKRPGRELALEAETEPADVALNDSREIRDFAPPPSGSSRYEPGVSELPEAITGESRQTPNGFRPPALPNQDELPRKDELQRKDEINSSLPSQIELLKVIREQQETIRQLQTQVQQLRVDQQRQPQSPQQATQGKSRSKR